MYNGIGLATVRVGHEWVRPEKHGLRLGAPRRRRRRGNEARRPRRGSGAQGPNAEIVAHNQKRAVEVKVFRLREALEAQDVPEAQVDEKCDALRRGRCRLDEALAHLLGVAPASSPAPKRRRRRVPPSRGARQTTPTRR